MENVKTITPKNQNQQMEVNKMANNLDAMINKISFDIVSQNIVDENQINKMLGVLANDGVYAWWVYIKSKKDINEKRLMDTIKSILNFMPNQVDDNYDKYFENLSQNLSNLLFSKEILEKILIYARYHAKAMGD